MELIRAISTSKEADINIVFIENNNDIDDFVDIKNPIFVKSKQDISKDNFKNDHYYNISSKNSYGIKIY